MTYDVRFLTQRPDFLLKTSTHSPQSLPPASDMNSLMHRVFFMQPSHINYLSMIPQREPFCVQWTSSIPKGIIIFSTHMWFLSEFSIVFNGLTSRKGLSHIPCLHKFSPFEHFFDAQWSSQFPEGFPLFTLSGVQSINWNS